jgi:hypothetical protein
MNTPPPTRALTLWRPWPWTFLTMPHAKRIENRPRPAPKALVGSWVLLHAGRHWDAKRLNFIGARLPHFVPSKYAHPTGIVGALCLGSHVTACADLPADQRRWWLGPVAIQVLGVVAFEQPIPCRGAQGYWTVPADVMPAVAAAWARGVVV